MERMLHKGNLLLALVILLVTNVFYGQSAGFNTSFIVLTINNGSNQYYDLQASTGNPDFNGANLGVFCQGSTTGIVFKGAEHNVYKCGGCDLTSTRVYYRIYPTGSPSGSFVGNSIGFASGFNNGCGGADQQWANTGYSTDLLSGLNAGNYTIEVYSDASVTCLGGTVYAGNGGANYKATFTVNANVDYYADADGDGYGAGAATVSCTGVPFAGAVTNNSDCNDSQVQYSDADGDGFGADTMVSCGGVANSDDCNDNQFQYADNDNDGFGSNTLVACGVANNSDCNDDQIQYLDADGDGFGSTTQVACGVVNSTDCNDNQFQYADNDNDGFGSNTLVACGVTNNSDCNDDQIQYLDADGDGFGSTTQVACGVVNSTDCNDNQFQYADNDNDGFGSNTLVACGVTNNSDCNDAQIQYADNDSDGLGSETLVPCGGVTNSDDCNDNDPLNLSGGNTYYADTDGDGYGNPASSIAACTQPVGYVANNTDCDDSVAAVNPGHGEVLYNGIDDNCDGNLDEGFQYTTNIQPAQCGTTLSTINSFIVAVSKPNTTRHRFEVTNMATNAVQTLERYQNYFSPAMLPSYDYATTYSIRVQIQRNGVWLGYYGPSCLVSTPAVLQPGGAASVSPSQCGATLTSISKLVATTSLPNVTAYRFRITNASDLSAPDQIQVIDRGPYNWFALTMLPTFNYGTTYLVEVSIKTNGVFSNYGSPCAVTAPPVPTLANCGTSIATKGTLVSTASLDRVTSYRFEITNLATSQVTTLDRSQNWFTFNNVPGFTPGGLYGVRLSVMTSGVYSLPGESCEITAPAAARTNDLKPVFDAAAYPNPFTDNFGIRLTTAAEAIVDLKVYDMTGRLIEAKTATIADMQTLQVGASYPSGVYNVVIIQGSEMKTVRVMKR